MFREVRRGLTDRIHLYEADSIFAMVQIEIASTAMYAGELNIAHIYFQKKLNLCWRRFVVCKEMYYCMPDRTDNKRVNTVDELNRLVELLGQDTSAVSGEFQPFRTERAAELMALETLFPVEYRHQLRSSYSQGKVTADEIAVSFVFPRLLFPSLFSRHIYRRSLTTAGHLFSK